MRVKVPVSSGKRSAIEVDDEGCNQNLIAAFEALQTDKFAEGMGYLGEYYIANPASVLDCDLIGRYMVPFFATGIEIPDELRQNVATFFCELLNSQHKGQLSMYLLDNGFVNMIIPLVPNFCTLRIIDILMGVGASELSTVEFLNYLVPLLDSGDVGVQDDVISIIGQWSINPDENPDHFQLLLTVAGRIVQFAVTSTEETIVLSSLNALSFLCELYPNVTGLFFGNPGVIELMKRLSPASPRVLVEFLHVIQYAMSCPVEDEEQKLLAWQVIPDEMKQALFQFIMGPLAVPDATIVRHACRAFSKLINGSMTVTWTFQLGIVQHLATILETFHEYKVKMSVFEVMCALMVNAEMEHAVALIGMGFINILSDYAQSMISDIPHQVLEAVNSIIRFAEEEPPHPVAVGWFEEIFGNEEILEALENAAQSNAVDTVEDRLAHISIRQHASAVLGRRDNIYFA